jgi:repressor LexA
MLTKKQRDLLILIHERMQQGEIAPSFDEMKTLLGLKSKSGIHRLIEGLVERGYLARLPHRARALEVLRLPEGYAEKYATSPPPLSSPTLIKKESTISLTSAPLAPSTLSIPLYGAIAAGTPIEAIRDLGSTVDTPPHLLGSGEHYALTVKGDSMIDAGIHNGDTVIIQHASTAENGQIIVALVDDTEVTLKRLRRKDGMIILQAENTAYEDRILSPDRVKVQGKLVSLMRTYH